MNSGLSYLITTVLEVSIGSFNEMNTTWTKIWVVETYINTLEYTNVWYIKFRNKPRSNTILEFSIRSNAFNDMSTTWSKDLGCRRLQKYVRINTTSSFEDWRERQA